jgi:hypothetical protein
MCRFALLVALLGCWLAGNASASEPAIKTSVVGDPPVPVNAIPLRPGITFGRIERLLAKSTGGPIRLKIANLPNGTVRCEIENEKWYIMAYFKGNIVNEGFAERKP